MELMKSSVQQLIDELSAIDLQIAQKPKRSDVYEIAEMIFGKSKNAKQQEKERVRALINKKYMLINAFVLPSETKEMVEFGNLALSNLQTIDDKKEKQAWENKFKQALAKMQSSVNQGLADDIADEYLFLSGEFEKIKQQEEKKRKGFFRFG